MNTATKTRIVAALGDAAVFLTIVSALPYSMGDVADVLGPKAKVYVTLGSAVCAGLLKFTQHAIQIIQATNTPDVAPLPAAPSPTQPPSVLNPSKL